MNRDMLMAALAHYSSPRFNPEQASFRYDKPVGEGRVFSSLVPWFDVARAALDRIEALERAEWFALMPKDQQWKRMEQQYMLAYKAEQLNASQAETIRRLQRELDEATQAIRV